MLSAVLGMASSERRASVQNQGTACRRAGKLHTLRLCALHALPMRHSLQLGVPVPPPVSMLSMLQVRDLVDHVVVVTEQQIVEAMRLCFERMKLVVEPSGAAGLAAVLAPGFADVDKRVAAAAAAAAAAGANGAGGANGAAADGKLDVGIILCGGNLDFESKGFFAMEHWVPHS